MKSAGSGSLLLVLSALYSWAAAAPPCTHPGPLGVGHTPIPRWVLVLSGGGARGMAQIGVLRVLERERLYPSAIVGTSIGAVIGGLWCAGYSADQIDSIVRTLDWNDLLRLSEERSRSDLFLDQKAEYDRTILTIRMENFRPVVPEAVSSGQRLERLLATLFWRAPYNSNGNFDRLRIPFCAVATDLVRGQTIAIRTGDLATAVRASSTFPLRYTPVRYDSLILVDGGLLANIPVHVAHEQFHPHIVVAVNTTSPLLPPSVLDKPWNVADQVVTVMMQQFNVKATGEADLTIRPQLGDHSMVDFDRQEWVVAQGEHATRLAVAPLRALLDQWTERLRKEEPSLQRHSSVQPSFLTAALDVGAVNMRRDSNDSVQEHSSRYRIVAIRTAERWLADSLRSLLGQGYSRWLVDSLVLAWNRKLRSEDLTMARLRLSYDTTSNILTAALDSGIVVAMEMVGNRHVKDPAIIREFRIRCGEPLRTNQLLESWDALLATDLFASVVFDVRFLDEARDGVVLTARVRERGSQVLRIGGRIDNERNVQPTIEIADLNVATSGLRALIRVGGGARNSIATLRLDALRILDSYWTASIESYWDSRNIYLYQAREGLPVSYYERIRNGERLEQHAGVRTAVGSNVETLGKVAITSRFEYQRSFQLGDTLTMRRRWAPLFALGWSMVLDEEDRADFPSHGSYGMLRLERTLVDLPGWLQFYRVEAMLRSTVPLHASHVIRWSVRFGIADKTLPLAESFNLGGEDLFFGMREEEERGRQLLLGQIEYRMRMPWDVIFPTYLQVRYDLGAIWQEMQAIRLDNLKHGVGITLGFDTPIGPARFSLGRAFYFRGTPVATTVGPLLGYFSIGMRIQ